MYLAFRLDKQRPRFFLRESYYDPEKGIFRSRTLLDLGADPGRFLEYPADTTFYVSEYITDHLAERGVDFRPEELEELFWPYVRPDIRRKLAPFIGRGRHHRRHAGTEKIRLHVFDRRRFAFLRCGMVDQRRLRQMPAKSFRELAGKSRDELEQHFIRQEGVLRHNELKLYVYVIFDLQRHFTERYARTLPQLLDRKRLDEYFLDDLCRLNQEEKFWTDLEHGDTLHEYLVRFAVMFFDFDFDRAGAWEEYLRRFMDSRRRFSPPSRSSGVSLAEASTIFGVKEEELRRMNRRTLVKLYRRKARDLHPDKGGEHEQFVELTAAYERLLRSKKK